MPIEFEPLTPGSFRILPKEEADELTRACPFWRVRMVGIERDGSPFDCVKRVRAPFIETAMGMLQVTATICHGCRVDRMEPIGEPEYQN